MSWVVIEDFPGYSVNPLGQVRNNITSRILRQQHNQFGVVFVGLVDTDGYQRQRGVAKLVAHTFIPQDLELFDTPINVDGDRWNNHVDNLMWRPRWFAIQYHMQFKQRYPYPVHSPIREISSGDIYRNSWAVVLSFGLLEKELVTAMALRTYVWPTYQVFELVG